MLVQFVKLNAILFEVAQLIKVVSNQGLHVHVHEPAPHLADSRTNSANGTMNSLLTLRPRP